MTVIDRLAIKQPLAESNVRRYKMLRLPKPLNWGTFQVESFADYRARWPKKYDHIPDPVIETWIYRHWREFQEWRPLRPLEWKYQLTLMTSSEVMSIAHVGDCMQTLTYWGDDLLDGQFRKKTPLGKYMLEVGTTPAPIIVAQNASSWFHPREHRNPKMREPYQIIEGHMRLAYLQAMVRRAYHSLQPDHAVFVATLPQNPTRGI